MPNVYITSSQRKIGKTFISAGLAATMQSLGYSSCVYKPIQTSGVKKNGFSQSPDLTYVKSIDPYIDTHFTYLFHTDTEPLIASELESNAIEIESIYSEYKKLTASHDCTIIDGENGILSPIAPNLHNIDIIKKLKIPTVIVTNPDINSVNNTLLNINTLTDKNIDIRGVIINDITRECNKTLLTSIPRIIEEYTNVKVIGLVAHLENSSPQDLITSVLNDIDIEKVFDIKIEKLDCV